MPSGRPAGSASSVRGENTAGCCGMDEPALANHQDSESPNKRSSGSRAAGGHAYLVEQQLRASGWGGPVGAAGWHSAAVLGELTQYY